jgi:uncharacterized protein (TIGR00730 family)
MDTESDAFVVLTGGIGTLEELVEMLTLKQLGYHDRPVVLLDPDGYWAPLRELFATMVQRRLAGPALEALFATAATPAQALAACTAAPAAAPPTLPEEALEVVEELRD